MKFGHCCFIAFIFYFGVKYSGLGSKGEGVAPIKILLSYNIVDKTFGEFSVNENVKKIVDSESSKGHTENSKKRNKKGVKPVFSCIINECNYKTFSPSNGRVVFITPFYSSCSFSGNAKRGPPQTSFS